MSRWNPFSKAGNVQNEKPSSQVPSSDDGVVKKASPKWSLGILQDTETDEVPGSVLLLSKVAKRNEPLGLQQTPARTSSSSLPQPYPPRPRSRSRSQSRDRRKKTADGKFVLDPQPDDSGNDPLNFPLWRRNAALLSLGFYCMIGGGMTPILAAGFNDVAETYDIDIHSVALTTGLYMMGLGIGCVVMSPTAILFGKRPVYLCSCLLFIASSVWCALSPNFPSLIVARIFQGIAVSPVECLPSASIAEIFFLHERAYRLGIYTLLLLGGKNLVPLVSAVIIQSLGWEWVFWIVAIILGFGGVLLFFFVPETFWDRTPTRHHNKTHGSLSKIHLPHMFHRTHSKPDANAGVRHQASQDHIETPATPNLPKKKHAHHVAFDQSVPKEQTEPTHGAEEPRPTSSNPALTIPLPASGLSTQHNSAVGTPLSSWRSPVDWNQVDESLPQAGVTPDLHNLNSPWYEKKINEDKDYFSMNALPDVPSPIAEQPMSGNFTNVEAELVHPGQDHEEAEESEKGKQAKYASIVSARSSHPEGLPSLAQQTGASPSTAPLASAESLVHSVFRDSTTDKESQSTSTDPETTLPPLPAGAKFTEHYRSRPDRTYVETLKIYHGRLSHDNWFRVALRPFILFAYPAILWSALVYALSVGWLIVLSESVTLVYKSRDAYNFTALQTGLVYLSPFIGGILGTAVAGKVSDIIVRFMARRNDGVYEPEFRLVMALPIAITSVIGLMGFGWSAEERDNWFVPTFFFGVISFGCSLGSTTSITFAVDSYRQYAGEALVTLNFAKNIFHGLIFSFFFTSWLESEGSKRVFIAVGGIQLACLLFTIPMYIYGKRARMWTVRRNLMEKF